LSYWKIRDRTGMVAGRDQGVTAKYEVGQEVVTLSVFTVTPSVQYSCACYIRVRQAKALTVL
jgi:hypothetical protein